MLLIGGLMMPDLLNLSPWRGLSGVIVGIHCKATGSRSFTLAINAVWTEGLPQRIAMS